jgi:hypothetical protein
MSPKDIFSSFLLIKISFRCLLFKSFYGNKARQNCQNKKSLQDAHKKDEQNEAIDLSNSN